MDTDNTIEACYDVTARTLPRRLRRAHAATSISRDVLKPNMVIAGQEIPDAGDPERIAALTRRTTCCRHVPALVPGIVFLSGGQSEVQATENLNAINRSGGAHGRSRSRTAGRCRRRRRRRGRATREVGPAQAVFLHRARMQLAAAAGRWSADAERLEAASS